MLIGKLNESDSLLRAAGFNAAADYLERYRTTLLVLPLRPLI